MNPLSTFLPSLTAENAILKKGDRWTTPKTDIMQFMKEHLGGGRSIGMRGADQIQFLMVDVDCHKGEPTQERLEILLNTFNGSGLPFRSSASNGIHFYIFLDKPTPQPQAREALRKQLISIKYPEAETVEIFPWSSRGHRLPFGAGNRPMPGGKDTLANTPKADQQAYFSKWLTNELTPYKVVELLEYVSISEYYHNPVKVQKRAKNKPREANTEQLTGKAFYTDPILGIDTLLNAGITVQGIRYKATNALAFYYITNQGLSKAETVQKITTWLDTKNNGNSACYNSNKPKAHKDIQTIVRAYDSSKLATEKAHKQAPLKAVHGIHFSNDEQRHFAQVIQRIAHKFGRKSNGEIIASIPYGLVACDLRFSNRNKIARCFSWAKASGLIRTLKTGFPGLGGSVYIISNAILYGQHAKPKIDKIQKLADLIQEHGTQKAVAELLGVSANMISKVLAGKKAVPKAWFEPVQVSQITQNDTLLSNNLLCVPGALKIDSLELLFKRDSQGTVIKGTARGISKGVNPVFPGIVKQSISNKGGSHAVQQE